ncbi:hypothetical protein [Scytonema sp. PCC 10023]
MQNKAQGATGIIKSLLKLADLQALELGQNLKMLAQIGDPMICSMP